MGLSIASIPRVPALGLVAATAAGGAALAALTPSIMPRSSKDQRLLAIGGGVLGAAAGGIALGALRLGKAPLGAAYGPVRTALTAAALIGSAAIVATHWGGGTTEPKPNPTYDPGTRDVIESVDEQRTLPAQPGTSAVGREKLDVRGLRFLDTITTGLPQQPVRVYAGLGTGATPQERVAFAIERMHEMGAFDKGRIVIAQPSGSGFVNQVPIQMTEMLAKGDVATVALQYGDQRSFSVDSILARDVAIEQHRMLIEAVHAEVEKLPAGKRPEVYLFGESLGGWTAQDAVTRDGARGFDDLGIKRALWVGTPGMSHWSENVPADMSERVTGIDKLNALTDADVTDRERVLEFRNPDDAVTKLDVRNIWKRPEYLREDSQRINDQVWIPGISMLQGGLDTYNAIAASRPGEFGVKAHDYRLAHAKAVQLAYDFPDVPASELEAMTDTAERLEQQYFATHPGA
ncbi:MAG: putative rane protein [Thermoleophilia bacterium]|nr:putative rane protein [Thermoleophilia bacterium]